MIYATAGSEYHEGDFFDKYSGLSSAIHLQGEVVHEQLRYWYSSADFIISSSHYEGSGIAVGEALSCGCIPILTQIPSFHTISDSGRLGLLYPAGDEEALLTKLEESLQLDHIALREQVLAWHRQQLSSDAVARKIVQVFSEESPNDE
jgi:glycosyltransferase involved in cell wall biosynthesis